MKWFLFLLLMPLLLRARLTISPSQEPEFSKTFDVNIEFQEVGIETSLGRQHDDISIRFDKEKLNCIVTDAQGHVLAPTGPEDMDVIMRLWDPLFLPAKGRLIFPIGAGGDSPHTSLPGNTPPATIPLSVGFMNRWTLPFTGSPYYLSGTVTVAPVPHVPHEEPYRG